MRARFGDYSASAHVTRNKDEVSPVLPLLINYRMTSQTTLQMDFMALQSYTDNLKVKSLKKIHPGLVW